MNLISVAFALNCPNGTDASGACILQDTFQTTGASGLIAILDTVTNWVFTALLAVAVLFIIIAGYKYILAQGSGEEVVKTHKMLLYAAIGIAVAVMAKGLVNVVKILVGGNGSGTTSSSPPTTPSTPATPPAGSPILPKK